MTLLIITPQKYLSSFRQLNAHDGLNGDLLFNNRLSSQIFVLFCKDIKRFYVNLMSEKSDIKNIMMQTKLISCISYSVKTDEEYPDYRYKH